MRPLALFVLLAMTGCARPIQQPLLNLGTRSCDPVPVLAPAVPVPLDQALGAEASLGMDGRCVAKPGGGTTTYAVFALPNAPVPYTLEIISRVMPLTIVRPRAMLLTAEGATVRTLEPEEFEPNIVGLRAGVRVEPSVRWLLVEADRSKLGQTVEFRLGAGDLGRVQLAASVPVIIIAPAYVPDIRRSSGGVYSLNGTVRVVATSVQTVP